MMDYPYVVFVFGTIVKPKRRKKTHTVTKYNEDTGKPSTKTITEEVETFPGWVEKLLARRESAADDCTLDEFENEPLTALDVDDGFLVGRKLVSIDAMHGMDPRKLSDIHSKDLSTIEKRLVRKGVARKDIGFVVGIRWC